MNPFNYTHALPPYMSLSFFMHFAYFNFAFLFILLFFKKIPIFYCNLHYYNLFSLSSPLYSKNLATTGKPRSSFSSSSTSYTAPFPPCPSFLSLKNYTSLLYIFSYHSSSARFLSYSASRL